VLRAGGAYVAISPETPLPRRQAIVRAAGARILVAPAGAEAEEEGVRTLALDALGRPVDGRGAGEWHPLHPVDSDGLGKCEGGRIKFWLDRAAEFHGHGRITEGQHREAIPRRRERLIHEHPICSY
jgi:hypothetical protein